MPVAISTYKRAKKQLANAGLSEADIAPELGNDPEALEDRLSDFSEKKEVLLLDCLKKH